MRNSARQTQVTTDHVVVAASKIVNLDEPLWPFGTRGALLAAAITWFAVVDLDQPNIRRETPGIPDNIGVSGPIVSDTIPMNTIQTLKDATRNEIVVINTH